MGSRRSFTCQGESHHQNLLALSISNESLTPVFAVMQKEL
jgi:hypothetical protein